ncbi:putative ribosomal lysine N-methyltransferase set10 [Elsinoe australis]|uniref:Putative ribosomal lysine N-methyltransferase set10 n=1 Tax=Elsinoe australis TaxID=40998 RepID=A0A4U7ARJ4_9PEZI|nr:putative ribosomal lysine N-methyltransferase set10 [Elsinoe australis]
MEALAEWLKANNGRLHSSTRLSSDGEQGGHLMAREDLSEGAQIMSVPHSLAMSCLNALVDDTLPVLKANADSFTVEALGVLYLMSQWLNKDKSFWKPYLDILPTPEQGFNTPFWFEEDDLSWLQGTDLMKTFEGLESAWRTYWRDDTKVLHEGGMDDIMQMGSHCIQLSKPEFQSCETSRQVPETRKDFPVLVPIMDCLNHNPDAKVDWTFEPGRFVLSLHEGVSNGKEVFNNYGPKSNSELLMGYGFCIEGNPYDCVFETLKSPPRELHKLLRVIHPGYFTTMGLWNSDAATFRLSGSQDPQESVWDRIPVPLVELFYYIVVFERGLLVTPIEEDPKDYLLTGHGRRVLPRIAFYIVSSLMPKITKITEANATLPSQPANEKQRYAKMYRDGQLSIMHSLREGLLNYNRSFRPNKVITRPTDYQNVEIKPFILTLEEACHSFAASAPVHHEQFVSGILSNYQIDDISALRGSEVEQHVWVLFLCAALISLASNIAGSDSKSRESERDMLLLQVQSLSNEYGGDQYLMAAEDTQMGDNGQDPEGRAFMGMVGKAAAAVGTGNEYATNIWKSSLWSCDLLLDWGLRIARSQGMNMRIADNDVRYVVYLHIDDRLPSEQNE